MVAYRPLLLFAALIATALGQAIPRPEVPEPQFERDQWQNLNGPWEFDFDDANTGLGQHWENAAHKLGRNITVPFCFESKLSGIADTAFHPNVWYRRSFDVPNTWKGKRVMLHFGAVNYWSSIWVNGQKAGSHEGGHVPFSFDVTSLLKPGGNVLTVRSATNPTDRYIPRGKQYWEPKSKSIFYTRTSGIWQTVWLEPVSESHLQSARITPNADGVASIYALIDSPQPGLMLRTTLATNLVPVAQTNSAGVVQYAIATNIVAPGIGTIAGYAASGILAIWGAFLNRKAKTATETATGLVKGVEDFRQAVLLTPSARN